MSSRKIPVERVLSDREIFDLIQNASAKNIRTIDDIEFIVHALEDATDPSKSFRSRLSSFIAGETRLSRGIGSALDVATIFIPHGYTVNKVRRMINMPTNTPEAKVRNILNRKLTSKPMPVLEDKPWYQSKTMWSVAIIVVTGVLQIIGVDPSANPEVADGIYRTIYTLAGAFGLYGLRDAVGKKKQ